MFKDALSMEMVRTELWNKDSKQIDEWEKSLKFISLRAESLGKESDGNNLLNEFGFPNQYAALINREGEYQVGNKIYWFNKGFKYEASSEEELVGIKENPSIAKNKFRAGIYKPSVSVNRTIRDVNIYDNSTTRGDGKYPYQFNIWNDPNSQRRLSFENFIYVEEVTGDPGRAYGNYISYYTAVVFNEYAEYYSRGSKRWYRSNEPRVTSYDLYVSGNAYGDGYSPYPAVGPVPTPTGPTHLIASNVYHSTGTNDYQTGLLQRYIYFSGYSGCAFCTESGRFTWDYEVNGTYSAYIASDQGKTHTESGVLW